MKLNNKQVCRHHKQKLIFFQFRYNLSFETFSCKACSQVKICKVCMNKSFSRVSTELRLREVVFSEYFLHILTQLFHQFDHAIIYFIYYQEIWLDLLLKSIFPAINNSMKYTCQQEFPVCIYKLSNCSLELILRFSKNCLFKMKLKS